ncbi:MAG: TatD family hydrolase [Acidobacteriota bacterium]
MLIDTHAHLDFPGLSEDIPGVLDRAAKRGVREVITIGTDLDSSRKAIDISRTFQNVYAAVGVHPHEAFLMDEAALDDLKTLARDERVVAIGEIGLDFHYNHQPPEVQKECLHRQLRAACEVGLPVVFHVREAHEEFLSIVSDYVSSLPGVVLHCFSGDWAVAERALAMGFYLSIPGIVTFPKSAEMQEVARRAPIDRLLVETDSPYLSPIPFRGKPNEPAHVHYTAQKIADLRRCQFDEIAARTTENAHTVFGLARFKAERG